MATLSHDKKCEMVQGVCPCCSCEERSLRATVRQLKAALRNTLAYIESGHYLRASATAEAALNSGS